MKLLNLINNKDDYDKANDILIKRILKNESISDNSMRDGFMIALFSSNHKTLSSVFINQNIDEERKPRYLDGTIQELELVIDWLCENDDVICWLLSEA